MTFNPLAIVANLMGAALTSIEEAPLPLAPLVLNNAFGNSGAPPTGCHAHALNVVTFRKCTHTVASSGTTLYSANHSEAVPSSGIV